MRYANSVTIAQPPERVLDALTDFAVVKAKYEAIGHRGLELIERTVGDDGSITFVTKRVVPVDVPGFAKRVLRPTNTTVEKVTWSAADAGGGRTATITADPQGVPVSVSGSMRLTAVDGGTEYAIALEVTCRLPVIGGRIAELAARESARVIDHDLAFTAEHLAGS